MKFRMEWLAAPAMLALVVGVSVAAQQQTGTRTTDPNQDRVRNPGITQQQQRGAETWDAEQQGMYPMYHEYWVIRYQDPEFQTWREQQQKNHMQNLSAQERQRMQEQQRMHEQRQGDREERNYDYFASEPTRWVNRHDGRYAWRESDNYWRESDAYFRAPERRNTEAARKYWDQSDRYWSDSNTYWQRHYGDPDRDSEYTERSSRPDEDKDVRERTDD